MGNYENHILSEWFQWGETDVEVVSATILYKIKWTLLTVDMSVACTMSMLFLMTPIFSNYVAHKLMYYMSKPNYLSCKCSTEPLSYFPAYLFLKSSLRSGSNGWL